MKNSGITEPLTQPPESRPEKREPAKETYNAEIKLLGCPVYQVKIADTAWTGSATVVNDDSSLHSFLTANRVLDVRYHSDEPEKRPDTVKQFKAEVKHVSEVKQGRYKGHRLVGIQILEND